MSESYVHEPIRIPSEVTQSQSTNLSGETEGFAEPFGPGPIAIPGLAWSAPADKGSDWKAAADGHPSHAKAPLALESLRRMASSHTSVTGGEMSCDNAIRECSGSSLNLVEFSRTPIDHTATPGTEVPLTFPSRHRHRPVAPLSALRRVPVTRSIEQSTSAPSPETRAHQIDAEVQANPNMPIKDLERLMRERDNILPLLIHPADPSVMSPAPVSTPPSGLPIDATSRWATVDPTTLPGSMTVAVGMILVPFGSGPPPVPPSVLFPELFAAEAGTSAIATAEVGSAVAVTAEAGTAAVATAEVATAGAAAGGSATIPIVGWIVAGVIVVGIISYLVYRHYSTPVAPSPKSIEAPGAPGSGPISTPGPPDRVPASLPSASESGPVSLPGTSQLGPMSLPGRARPDGPLLTSGLPMNRTDFPTRDAALSRAQELARTVVNGNLEELERAQVFGNLEEKGNVIYYRRNGSTAVMSGEKPCGNIVVIVEHTSDPTQPPHFHVVRPPTIGKRIEHGGEYLELFAGTPDQHLTILPDSGSRRSTSEIKGNR